MHDDNDVFIGQGLQNQNNVLPVEEDCLKTNAQLVIASGLALAYLGVSSNMLKSSNSIALYNDQTDKV